MLPLSNRQVPTGDMPALAIDVADHNGNGRFDDGDELLFYGMGADRWYYSASNVRWMHERHAYATHNCYYLTTSAPAAHRIATANGTDATAEVATYTDVALIDNDLVNIYQSGQVQRPR